ncbi:hypothetical protein ACA910_006862 [Epithemia clementina (nom. ined.)]
MAQVLHTFFLTDHCLLNKINKGGLLSSWTLLEISDLAKGWDHETSKKTVDPTQSPLRAAATTTTTPTTTRTGVEPNAAATTTTPVVVPLTRCDRRSVVLREHDGQELRESGQNDQVRFELDDSLHDDAVATTTVTAATTTTPVPPQPHVWYWPAGLLAQLHLVWHHNRLSPWFQIAVVGTALIGLLRAATVQIQLDSDWANGKMSSKLSCRKNAISAHLFAVQCRGTLQRRQLQHAAAAAFDDDEPPIGGFFVVRRTTSSTTPAVTTIVA